MKKNKDIKLMLMGIAILALYPMCLQFDGNVDGIINNITFFTGFLSPLIGMPLCIIGFISNSGEKESSDSTSKTEADNETGNDK